MLVTVIWSPACVCVCLEIKFVCGRAKENTIKRGLLIELLFGELIIRIMNNVIINTQLVKPILFRWNDKKFKILPISFATFSFKSSYRISITSRSSGQSIKSFHPFLYFVTHKQIPVFV